MLYFLGTRDNKHGLGIHSCSLILPNIVPEYELAFESDMECTGFPNSYVLDESSGTLQVRLKTEQEQCTDLILKINEEINEYRDLLTLTIYTHTDGHRYDVDFKSRQNITGTLAILFLAPDDTQLTWRDADNIDVVHTKLSFMQLTNAIFLWTTGIYEKSWHKKEQLKAMTLAELQNYNPTLDW